MPEPFAENLWHQSKDDVGVGNSNVSQILSTPGAVTAIINALIENLDITGDTTFLNAVIDATYPPGTYKWQAHATPDFGFLACDGTAVSRATYARLFAKISTTYGAGDGSTTFNLPNVKGRTLVHQDTGDAYWNAMGESRGANTATLAVTNLAAHDHGLFTGPSGGISSFTSAPVGGDHDHGPSVHQFVRTSTTGGDFLAAAGTQRVEFFDWTATQHNDDHYHNGDEHEHDIESNGSGTAFDITQKSIVGFCTIRY